MALKTGWHLLLWMIAMLLPHPAIAEKSLESSLMPGKVIEGHAKYENECKHCHKRFNKSAQAGLCLDCHKKTTEDVRARKGLHGHLDGKDCRECHTEHKGRNAKLAEVDRLNFDHDQTGFLLRDKHASAKCEGCHKPKSKYREAPAKCDACHRKEDVHKGKLGHECGNCHDAKGWKKSSFDHERTAFPLIGGKHADVVCRKCHASKEFKGAPKECSGCHRKDDQAKGHKGRYGNNCKSCHTNRGWKELRFNHDRDTRYPLRGKHQPVKCDACHLPAKGALYKQKLPSNCVSCHRKDDQAKGHKGDYGSKCESCHTEKDWKQVTFDHNLDTRYILKDKHLPLACKDCHPPGKALYGQKLGAACISCHRKDDKHKNQLGAKCETCHKETRWQDAPYDHAKARFILAGSHAGLGCKKCHATPAFRDVQPTCAGCHQKEDVHKKQLGQKCEDCHNSRSWKSWNFNHDRRTRYKLDGAHVKTPCLACHRTPVEKKFDVPLTCAGCHGKNDVHDGNFGAMCERCHVTGSFSELKEGGSADFRR